ncbi:hypothetical protein Moror_13071 [Moniliophthora roreri MCA 2997]|uniref:DUF6535 domain-containing protein n=1 Tax=Moniliophthora roreri (strain MCA 2997) TaxID=1381753 RepID=V2XLT9_MONRO|nr:hypothetical protein Moror_13071 [Moniliophthora roreri MCA 2997]KAI3604700.1 hypothetical protein WG66_008476 [Moniliophthora roreri]
MSTLEQIPLPPSAQSVQGGRPTSYPGTASQQAYATGKTEERKGPAVQQSWEELMAEVEKYDEGTVKSWKEDIDTLLVFAGLFSAVVTAFLIEAYQWLSEDPADTTVLLLTQIFMQLNASQTILPERPKFEPDASSIRINCWWFLSLVFSLTSALFGLLCKQWLREQQRDPPTRTPAEALALRQIRRDGFEKWGMSLFLSVLPILLEVALLFFFVGILDLLWARHPIPFAFCLFAVVLSAGLYLVTTFLPVLAFFSHFRKPDEYPYHFICPYKSPQAWAVYQLLFKALHALRKLPSIESYINRLPWRLWFHILNPASDWSSLDLQVIRLSSVRLSDSDSSNVYELRAFQWAYITFQDSPSMLPHLQNVLGTIPPSVVMSAVLGDWTLAMWGDIQKSDIELWFSDQSAARWSRGWYIHFAPEPNLRDPTFLYSEGIRLLYFHQSLQALATQGLTYSLIETIMSHQADLQNLVNLRFVIPFSVIEKLWTHGDPYVREQSSQLFHFFEDAFSTHPGYDEEHHDWERLAFISALTNHLSHTDFTSYVATSPRGQEFIRFVHDQIISRCLYNHGPNHRDAPYRRQELLSKWIRVTQRITEIGHRPADFFMPIPGFSEESAIRAADAAIPLPIIDPDHPQEENDSGPPQSDHQKIEDGRGSGVPGLTERGDDRASGSSDPSINPGHPSRADDRHSEYKMTADGQGSYPGSAERGDPRTDKVGVVGADGHV